MSRFIPSILEREIDQFQELVEELSRLTDEVHIDITDDTLVAGRTVLPAKMPTLPAGLNWRAHLMVDQPTDYFEALTRLGCKGVIIHVEARQVQADLESIFKQSQSSGFDCALSINPGTDRAVLNNIPLNRIDHFQIMGVEPGAGGRPMAPGLIDRIKILREQYPDLQLSVDGAVRLHNAQSLLDAGADFLVIGRGGYELDGSIASGLEQWQQLLDQQG